jgi:hypothetical protein
VGESRFDTDDVARERELADALGNFQLNVNVGFWDGRIITYNYLSPRVPLNLGPALASLGKNEAEISFTEEQAEARLKSFEGPLRAYAGWLMANPAFREEHDRLLERHWREIRSRGSFDSIHTMHSSAESETTRRQSECLQFYSRWRLQKLEGPGLPIPLAPQVPDIWNISRANPRNGVRVISIPDISPISGQGNVVETLEDSLRGGDHPQHLAEWLDIASRENVAKNMLPAYERQFHLQHFWRVLQHRFSDAFARRKTALRDAFAEYLRVSEDTIKGDLKSIAQRLGTDWDQPSHFFG